MAMDFSWRKQRGITNRDGKGITGRTPECGESKGKSKEGRRRPAFKCLSSPLFACNPIHRWHNSQLLFILEQQITYLSTDIVQKEPARLETRALIEEGIRAVRDFTPAQRIEYWCAYFAEKPFLASSCGDRPGEGGGGKYCINFNQFDCVAFANTAVALAHSSSYDQFEKRYLALRYNGGISYCSRNHFIEQWYRNNVVRQSIFSPLPYDVFPPGFKRTLDFDFNNIQWITDRGGEEMRSLPGSFIDSHYRFKLSAPVFCVETMFSAVRRSGLMTGPFLTKHSYLSHLKSGDVMVFIWNGMIHLGIIIVNKGAPEVCSASSIKGKVTSFDLVHYLNLLHTMRVVKYVSFLEAGNH